MQLAELLQDSISKHASDLHLVPGMYPLMRINGDLVVCDQYSVLLASDIQSLLYGILSADQQELFEKNLVADLSVSLPSLGHFRVSLLHQLRGVGAVFRIIAETVPTLDGLGLPAIFEAVC